MQIEDKSKFSLLKGEGLSSFPRPLHIYAGKGCMFNMISRALCGRFHAPAAAMAYLGL